MPHKLKCKNCGKEFNGPFNKKYCSGTCKNDLNNAIKREERKFISRDVKSLEKNIQIINQILDSKPPINTIVTKHELQERGFDFEGPFRIRSSSVIYPFLIVGKYLLSDQVSHFICCRLEDTVM